MHRHAPVISGKAVFVDEQSELAACTPVGVQGTEFNTSAALPYGCTSEHVRQAMSDFLDLLGFINNQLHGRQFPRLETFLMQASFSGMVGEFMAVSIPKYCPTLVKNRYHNGHPDLVPTGYFTGDSILHGGEGIEIKASRYTSGWQEHNAEDVWLMVFVFECNGPNDATKNILPKPFRFLKVVGAQITKDDWQFAGRSATSRRTITATVKPSGFAKMEANWVYRAGVTTANPTAPRPV